jgi:hypothetical protein
VFRHHLRGPHVAGPSSLVWRGAAFYGLLAARPGGDGPVPAPDRRPLHRPVV